MLSPNQNWVRNIYYWPLDPDLEINNFLFRWRPRYDFLGQWTFQKEANDGYPWTYTRTSCINTRLLWAILANYWTMVYNSVPPPGWVWPARCTMALGTRMTSFMGLAFSSTYYKHLFTSFMATNNSQIITWAGRRSWGPGYVPVTAIWQLWVNNSLNP